MKPVSLQVFMPGYTSFYYVSDDHTWRIYPDRIVLTTKDGKRKTVFKGAVGVAITYMED